MTRAKLFLVMGSILIMLSVSGCGYNAASQPTTTEYIIPIPPSILGEGWDQLTVTSVCLEINQDIRNPKDYELPLFETISVTLSGVGIQVSEGEQICDVTLSLDLEGEVLGGYYSDASGKCYQGVKVTGQMVLTSKGKPPLSYPLDFHKNLPEIIPKGSCNTDSVEGLRSALISGFDDFLLRGLTSFWGPRVIVWALNDTDFLQRTARWTLISEQHMQLATGSDQLDDVEAEIIPDLVLLLVLGNDYTAKSTALNKLRRIGLEAKQAIPMLIYLLERREFDILTEEDIIETLESISGESFGDSTKRWRSWWESQ